MMSLMLILKKSMATINNQFTEFREKAKVATLAFLLKNSLKYRFLFQTKYDMITSDVKMMRTNRRKAYGNKT